MPLSFFLWFCNHNCPFLLCFSFVAVTKAAIPHHTELAQSNNLLTKQKNHINSSEAQNEWNTYGKDFLMCDASFVL